MKDKKLYISTVLLVLITGVLIVSCQEEEDVFEKTRLFRPVLSQDLLSENNVIIVDMGNMKEALSYTIEVSRDTFQTIVRTVEADTNYIEIGDLLWNTIYQLRATAHAADPQYNSKISDLGAVKTQRFPSIMGIPESYDVTDVGARIFWTTAGAPVTGIKVFASGDEKLTEPLLEIEVTADDQEAEEKAVFGLDPLTEYIIAIYSNGNLRGFEKYTTKTALPAGDAVIDLRGIEKETILADTLPDIPGGSIVILESGKVYSAGGYEFDKSLSIRSGYGFSPGGAIIDCGSNFNIVDGSAVDSIVFRGLTLKGEMDGNYVFNIDVSGSINELRFASCHISTLRGIVRMKGGAGTLSNYAFYDCLIDSIGGYGLLTVDTETWRAENISFINSTISKAESFIVSKNSSTSILLGSCTINEAPKTGNRIFRYRTEGADNVANGISIYNCIWGPGWDMEASGEFGVSGFEGLGATNFEVINTYATSDFSFSSNPIPGFPSISYTGTASDLWVAPAELDYNFQDPGFGGKASAGDPEWRLLF